MNKVRVPTRNIRKPGSVGNLNFCTFNKNYNGLTSWSFEIPASAYCHPLCGIQDKQSANIKLDKMILKSKDSKHREFKGVNFEVLATGDKSMVTKMNYKNGDKVPFHSHPNEQSGYVISGDYIIQYGQITDRLKPGDSYCIPENIEHSWEVIKGGEVIDVFTPPRLDYV